MTTKRKKNIQTATIQSKVINGHTYEGNFIPATEAVGIVYQLIPILGGKVDNIEPLIASDDQNLLLKIFSCTTRNGSKINSLTNFNKTYSGNLSELMQALQYVVEANFKDFLQGKGTGLLSEMIPLATAPNAEK